MPERESWLDSNRKSTSQRDHWMHSLSKTIVTALIVVTAWGCATGLPEREDKQPPAAKVEVPRFPRVHDLGDSLLTVHEPQIVDHEGYTRVTAWAAVVNEQKNGGQRSVGAIKVSAELIVDFDRRSATLYNRRLEKTYFPELSDAETQALVSKIKALARNEPETMPLDSVLAYIAQADSSQQRAEQFVMAPPKIFFSDHPAVLVQFGGEPVFKPLASGESIAYAVNTNWDVFRNDEHYHLLLGNSWITATSADGPWQPSEAPLMASLLPQGKRFDKVRKAIPGQPIAAADIPRIFVTTRPAELIVIDGEPRLQGIAGTELAFVSNSSQDIVYRSTDRNYYLLLSGRWFLTQKLEGPWNIVDELPKEFSRIPDDHPRAHVRAAIPGTDEAKTAVVEANIPVTAAISSKAKAPKVRYAGNPVFEAIEDTGVARAANTSFDVLRVAGRYYLCYEGVWFESAEAHGPWVVAGRVPDAIYLIPASSPAYHVTFVKIYNADEEEILVGYTSGYKSTYVVGTTVVYGSGYYWPPYWTYYPWGGPWYWYDDDWYWYAPYPYSYGSASYYNPVTGSYRHGDYVYGPGGGYGIGESYNDRSGRRSTSEYSWDYNSAEYSARAYNPKRGTASTTRQDFRYDSPNSYESWGSSTVTKGDEWIRTKRYSNQDGRSFKYETSAGGKGGRVVKDGNSLGAIKTVDGDLYVGNNGQVYRRGDDGSWQQRDKGDWSDIDTSHLETARENAREKVDSMTPSQREAARQRARSAEAKARANVSTPAQRSAANRRLQLQIEEVGTRRGNQASSQRIATPRSSTQMRPSIDRHSYQQINRGYRARSFGNSQRSLGGRSFSGGGFNRGGMSRGRMGGGAGRRR